MPDATLRDLVLKHLEADTQPEDEEGPEAAKGASFRGAGGRVGGAEESAISAPTPQQPRTLDLTPGPGLTLVVGRNGSGKSSFAEGLELLLTGDTCRWSDRSRIWRDGWRGLHHPKAALAAAASPATTPTDTATPVATVGARRGNLAIETAADRRR